MGKEKKAKLEKMKTAGMHELKNKKMPHVSVNKRRGKILTNKKKRRALKIVAAVSALVVMFVGVFAVAAFGGAANRNEVDAGFATVSKVAPADGSKPTDHSALDNIAYMNYVFHNQANWYSETHGTTVAAGISQSVNTWKQYDDEILVMADITYSSLVNQARQICYVGDEVLWREAANTNYDGLNTKWSEKLKGHLSLDEFVRQNGLPGTEFCVYVINEETLLSADEVADNGDGTYSQTYYLNPARDKAPAHYINQMIFTGGIKDADFNHITVTYTFDEKWQVVAADVDESYYASMGFSVTCTSAFHVFYEYNTEKAVSTAYDDYFKQYAGTEIGGVVNEPTAMGCLGEAFGGVLSGPSVLELDLDLNGKRVDGVVCLDLSDMDHIDVRAKLGEIYIWYADNCVYLSCGGTNVRMGVNDLTGLVSGLLPAGERQGTEELDLASLFIVPDDGFSFDETSAALSAKLSLKPFGIDVEIPVDFAFALEKQTDDRGRVSYCASLVDVNADVAIEGFALGARLAFGEKSLPALDAAEKENFIDLMPYVNSLVGLFTADALHVDVGYRKDGFAVNGGLDLSLKELCVAGTLDLTYNDLAVSVGLIFENNTLYLKVGDLKVKAGVSEILAFVGEFAEIPELKGDFDLVALIDKVLAIDFASLVEVTEQNDALQIAVSGTELLKAFMGEESFALGQVAVAVNADGLTASALGIDVALRTGKAFATDTDGYSDLAQVFPYIMTLSEIFTSELLHVELAYGEEGGLRVAGAVDLSLKGGIAAAGTINVTIADGETETALPVSFTYAEGLVYLDALGAKLKLDPSAAVAFLLQYPGGEGKPDLGESFLSDLLGKLFTAEFNEKFTVTAQERFSVVVKGTELLSYLGLGDFALGEVRLGVDGDSLTANLFGVSATVTGAEGKIEAPAGDYRDATNALSGLLHIIETKQVSFRGSLDAAAGTEISLVLRDGFVSWENGVHAVVNATLFAGGTAHDISVEATDGGLRLTYGKVGVELAYGDLETLKNALTELYNYIAEQVNSLSEGGDVLAAADSLEGIVNAVKGLISLFTAVQSTEEFKLELPAFDLVTLVKAISLSDPEDGLLAAELFGAKIVLREEQDGTLALKAGVALAGAEISADLVLTKTSGAQMPNVEYLGCAQLGELLGFVKSAVQTLLSDTFTATVSGTTYTTDAGFADGIKNRFTANAEYYSGAGVPVHFNLTDKNFYVNTDLYLHLSLTVENFAEGKDNLYLDAWVLDRAQDGSSDGVLDLYVKISRVGSGSGALCVHMTADELATVGASTLALLGVDVELLDDLLVNARLDTLTVDALKTVGDRLKKSLDFDGLLGVLFASPEKEISVQSEEELRGYLSALTVSGTALELKLDSALLFGGAGKNDFTVALTRNEKGLTGVTLLNLYADNGDRTDANVTLTYEEFEQSAPELTGEYYELEGIAELLGSIAKSATHYDKDGNAKLNDFFYIDGTVNLNAALGSLSLKNLNVPLRVSVKVAEDGNVSANIYVKVPALKIATYTIIQGETEVFFTLEKGMIYLRRVQYTDAGGNAYAQPEEMYRAMPLRVFGADIMNQIGFMFNLAPDILTAMAGDGSGVTLDTSGDYGTLARSLIASCIYMPGTDGDSWELKINGKTFLKDLSDIAVTLHADGAGVVRSMDLGLNMTVYSLVTVTVNGTLNYRNPRDEVAIDKTENIAGTLSGAMSKAIREAQAADWKNAEGAPFFAEGKTAEITYLLGVNEAGKQTVVYNTSTGELLADLVPPQIDGVPQGYEVVWDIPADGKIPATLNVYGRTEAKRFEVVLESEKPLDGFGKGGNGLYTLKLTYVYGDGLYTQDGEKYLFPEVDLNGERVKAFANDLFAFSSFADCTQILADTVLTAEWEKIVYTVTFVADGKTVEVQSAYFGEPYALPTPEKTGHDFAGWFDEKGNEVKDGTVAGSMTLTAKFVAKQFSVTLLSPNAADGVFEFVDGAYKKTLTYTYGGKLLLPTGEYGDLFLKGYMDGDGTLYTEIENIFCDLELNAVWTNISVVVTFVTEDGEKYVTLNCEKGDLLVEYTLPAVPAKEGHTGVWNVSGDTLVESAFTVTPVYTPNVYTVSVYSDREEKYVFETKAEYGTSVSIPQNFKIPCYDFGGIFTAEGERVESVTVQGDTELSILWIDNTVEVLFMGEALFEGSAPNGLSYYSARRSFNDDYTIDYKPAAAGYQQLGGWWYQSGESWQEVTDVRSLKPADGSPVVLWSVWVENVQVVIEKFYTDNYASGKRYNVEGYVTGGRIKGRMGETIFAAVATGDKEALAAQCVIWGSSKKKLDAPGGGDVATLNYDANGKAYFKNTNMESLTYNGVTWLGGKIAELGGVNITKTFYYAGGKVETKMLALVTLDKYTVNVKDSFGNTIKTVEGHHEVATFDVNSGYTLKPTYLKDALAGVDVPVVAEYEFVGWDLDLNTEIARGGSLTAVAQYRAL